MIDWRRVMILSGPSGAGKDTVLDAWQATGAGVERVITCTTRNPRPGERHGVDYFFLTAQEFDQMVKADAFLEYKPVHQHWYATPMSEIRRIQGEGKVPVLRIDVQGAEEVVRKHPEVCTVFIHAPSMEVLEQRLRGRATESEDALRVRLENAKMEVAESVRFLHQVVNDDLENAVEALEHIREGLV